MTIRLKIRSGVQTWQDPVKSGGMRTRTQWVELQWDELHVFPESYFSHVYSLRLNNIMSDHAQERSLDVTVWF